MKTLKEVVSIYLNETTGWQSLSNEDLAIRVIDHYDLPISREAAIIAIIEAMRTSV
jgi:hypothetical protein